MPIYAYKCQKCNQVADYQLPILHDVPKHCRKPMTRIFTVPGVAFKGPGFTRQPSPDVYTDDPELAQIKRMDPDARLIRA